jgi:hypothetical protein
VLAYRDREADIRGWTELVGRVVTDFAPDLDAIQVTGEANLTGIPDAGDGDFPGAIEALVHGTGSYSRSATRTAHGSTRSTNSPSFVAPR